jgi:2-polyprenyl-3-methyl-5-hydroxy-6-metoxy-1,4-benzoquinol methylase
MNKYLKQFWSFSISKILLIISFINNTMTSYINYITRELDNPNTDSFERFYYNLFIFIYWTIIHIKQLIINLLMVISMEWKIKKIQIYELIFGNKQFKLSTPNLFYSVLKELPPNSTILDFGCGSGVCYKNIDTINLIVKSDFKITGIDINELAIHKFKERVNSNSLTDRINLKYGDIFKMEINEKFDYIILSESAPLLSKDFMIKIIFHIKNNLLKSGGKIIFINNLIENPQFITCFTKPKLKYVTSIDFGRVITKDEFFNLALDNKMNVKFELLDSMTIEQITKYYNIYFIYKIFTIFGFKNYDVMQYKITLE